MTRNEGSALFLMWAYWDHPQTRAPGCPLITSRGQPLSFLLLQVTFFPRLVFTRMLPQSRGLTEIGKKCRSSARYGIHTHMLYLHVASINQHSLSALFNCAILPYSPSQTSLSSHLFPTERKKS